MSRRKQANPRSLKRDEEWNECDDANILSAPEKSNETSRIKHDENEEEDEEEDDEEEEEVEEDELEEEKEEGEDEEEEEELRHAFNRQRKGYVRHIRSASSHVTELGDENSLNSDVLGTGSSSWQSEDGGPPSRRGGETPSSCATPTSTSFPSEPEADTDAGINAEGSNSTAPYPCQFCDRTFPRLSYLKKHEQSHGDQMPYRCSWCARLFKHKRSRDRHVKLHTGDRRYRCSHCEAAFSRSDHLKIHMKTHDTQKPYQCTACSRGYNTAAALTSHMQSHKKHNQLSTHGPTKLQDIEYGRRSVSSHSTSSPPIPSSPSPSLNNLNSKCTVKTSQTCTVPAVSALNSPLKLACMYCTRDSFSCMQQLQMHVHTMHQSILNRGNVTIPPLLSRITENLTAKADEKTQEKTDNAPQKFDRKYEKANTNCTEDRYDNTFTCNQCTMKFSTLSSLREHLVSIHRNDGFESALMMCPLCGTPCSSTAAYAEHYVLQHCENRHVKSSDAHGYNESKLNGYEVNDSRVPKNKDFHQEPTDLTNKHATLENSYSAGTLLCGQCGAALKDFESFREHLARHLQADQRNQEVSRHPCPKCDTSFSDREDMLAHLTKHYLGQISKEYACGACQKLYPHPDLLQRHLLDCHAHHLYRCALCRDTFDSRVAIQVHFAVKHSQECRVYRCNACTVLNNENSPGNAPGEGKCFFRSESEMASHVRNVHAPSSIFNNSPLTRSPVSTPGMTGNSGPRCVFCGIYCSSELDHQLHLASHSTSLYRCPICREGFAVEFLLDRHITHAHHHSTDHHSVRGNSKENGRHRSVKSQEDAKPQKRGRSPASSNNNSLNQRDNNTKRPHFGGAVTIAQQSQDICDLCERNDFANEAELQAHKKIAHPSKAQTKSISNLSMTCAYCGEVCRSRSDLESHTRIQHASNEPGGRHKCNICDEVCPSGAILAEHKLQKHCKIQLSDTCIVCRSSLTTESQFLEHIQRHSLENVESQQRLDSNLSHLPTPCVVCRQTLISDLECRLHARHHLRSVPTPQNSSPSANQMSQNPECCLCLRDFSSEEFVSLPPSHISGSGQPLTVCKSCYIRHSQGLPILNLPYEKKTQKCEKPWTPDKNVQEQNSNGRWNERVLKRENYLTNEIVSTDKKKCNECGVKFEYIDEIEHRINKHRKHEATTYTCAQCQTSSQSKAEIRQHVKRQPVESSEQNSIRLLHCHLCIFKANNPLHLQSHLIEHTFAGCTTYSCYICQALFTAPIDLQNHMVEEHGHDAQPYDCSRCTLKFFFRTELDHHTFTHHCPRDHPVSDSFHEAVDTRSFDKAEKHLHGIDVKEELIPEAEADDEENVNVEEHVEHEEASDYEKQTDVMPRTEFRSGDKLEKVKS